jgi:hypothetical protein
MERVLFFTASSETKVDDVTSQVEGLGFKLADRLVAATVSSVDGVVHSTSERVHQSKLGLLIGAVMGWHVGLALLIFIGSPALYQWTGAALIPVGGALGWAALGGIVGGSGVFSKSRVSARLEDHFEKEVGLGKILVSLHVRTTKELNPMAEALHRAGVTEVYYSGKLAA